MYSVQNDVGYVPYLVDGKTRLLHNVSSEVAWFHFLRICSECEVHLLQNGKCVSSRPGIRKLANAPTHQVA